MEVPRRWVCVGVMRGEIRIYEQWGGELGILTLTLTLTLTLIVKDDGKRSYRMVGDVQGGDTSKGQIR